HQSIGIFRHNLQNLVELAESFRETAERYIELRVPGKQVDAAWIKPLGFLEVGLASFPLSLVACDKSERPRYATAIGEELSRSVVTVHGGLEVSHASVVVVPFCYPGFAQIRVERERGLVRLAGFVSQGDCRLKIG